MTLYEQWNGKFTTANAESFVAQYYKKEKEAYASILAAKEPEVKTTVKEFARKFSMEPFEAVGFVEGINTSLKTSIAPEELNEESEIVMNIDWRMLYINMHKAKAPWLYELPEWEGIYSEEERNTIMKDYHRSVQAVSTKVGRNSPCPCGSGKKYKNCCGRHAV